MAVTRICLKNADGFTIYLLGARAGQKTIWSGGDVDFVTPPEFSTWCDDNLIGTWKQGHYVNLGVSEVWATAGFWIDFEHETDALLFKLRWL